MSRSSRKYQSRPFKKGDVVYNVGDVGDELYLIHSGNVSIISKNGLLLSVLGPGEIFGESAPVTNSSRSATVIADTNCIINIIDSEQVRQKIKESDPVIIAIIRSLSLRLKDTNILTEKYWNELNIYKSLE
ncbi:cyclic nucleotide-binding domain-containing protein [Candidatus Puniceispirillum sp.]|uniref:cyclic nucleotide-binding domain-containing protein n=1 Tax=Candidatus Puniceispirillum sp. TaxID=2026719 RepID=UPI003F699535